MNRNGNGVDHLAGSSPQIDVNPAWSADGSGLAFVSYRDGDWAIYTMGAHGAGPTSGHRGRQPVVVRRVAAAGGL